MSDRPRFIIIGAMKCATTTLHAQLAAQPGVFMTDKDDEPSFFSNDDRYARGPDAYAALFDAAAPGDLCGEASTDYTKLPTWPHTVERMRRDLPDARLIYVMRHPIARLVSHYTHDWTENRITTPIDQAVDHHPELIDYGRYAMQLRPYLESFGPDRVLPVFFERLTADSQAELERVCQFIGYGRRPVWQVESAQTNASSQRLRKSGLRDLIVNAPGMATLRRALVPQAVRDRIKRIWSIKGKPELSPAVDAKVAAAFDADLAELGSWLGVELSCGTFKSVAMTLGPRWSTATPRPAAISA